MAIHTNDDDSALAGQGAAHQIIRGAGNIGRYLGDLPERTAQHLLRTGRIPGFLIGGVYHAYPETLDAWLGELNDGALRRSFSAGGFRG